MRNGLYWLNAGKSNYAFNPIAEQSLRSNQTIVPQRVNAALDFVGCVSFVVSAFRGLVARLPRRGARQNEFGAAGSVRIRARWRAVGLRGKVVVPELAPSCDVAACSLPRPRASRV